MTTHATQRPNPAGPSPTQLAAVGSLITAINDFGVKVTAVVESVGHGAIASNSDVIVMGTIRIRGPQRPNELSRLTHLTSGGTTNLLDRLETAGFVVRSTDGLDDGRGVLVALTEDGREAIEDVGDVFATHVAADHHRFDEMRRGFAALGLDIPVLPSSLTDVEAQLRDIVGLARFGQQVTELLSAVVDDPTPTKSMLTLWYASQPEGIRPGRLTQLTGLSSAGVSELLERLELRHLVERTAGRPPDRRVVIVTTTEAGHRELDVALAQLADHLDELHAGLVAR